MRLISEFRESLKKHKILGRSKVDIGELGIEAEAVDSRALWGAAACGERAGFTGVFCPDPRRQYGIGTSLDP